MNSRESYSELVALLKESMASGRQPLLTVTSNSMAPLVRKGDQIILTKTSAAQLNPGDIITIKKETYLLTHRYYRITENMLVTRGDRLLQLDPPTPKQALIGKVVATKQNNKYLYLNKGVGKKLNAHIAWMAQLENNMYYNEVNIARYSRKIFYMWALGLTKIVIGIFGSEPQATNNRKI